MESTGLTERHAGVDEPAPEPERQSNPQSERPAPYAQATATIVECPLHTAVRRLARAAVTQHVFYAEGEYAARPNLVDEMHAWIRIHDLVGAGVCPASRASSLTPAEIELSIVGVTAAAPEELRADLRAALLACGARSPGEGCPVEREPAKALFE